MSNLAEIEFHALSLPIAERIELAHRLWESIEQAAPSQANEIDEELLAELRRRDEELSTGKVQAIQFEEAMREARRAIQCK